MPRAKNRVASRNRRKKILTAAKGNYGKRRSCIRAATETVQRAGQFSYRDRRVKKRNFRALWIMRINAAARQNGMSYSAFMHLLKEKNVELDRKVLAHMALHQPESFASLVSSVKS